MQVIIKYHVREMRDSKGLTLRQLEELSGVSNGHISHIERGIKEPSLYVLCRLAFAMKCDVRELFTYCFL